MGEISMTNFTIIKRCAKSIKVKSAEGVAGLIVSNFERYVKKNYEVSFAVLIDEKDFIQEIILDQEGAETSVGVSLLNLQLRCIAMDTKKIMIFHTHPGTEELVLSHEDKGFKMFTKSFFAEANIKLIDFGIISYNRNMCGIESGIKEIPKNKVKLETFFSIYDSELNLKGRILKNYGEMENRLKYIYPIKNTKEYITV